APQGVRSYGPIRPYRHLDVNPSTVNDNVLCFVMIETLAGLECVDDICATPGIDGVYVGPADLALSLNLHPQRTPRTPSSSAPSARSVTAAGETTWCPQSTL